jgi:hypothetical protein
MFAAIPFDQQEEYKMLVAKSRSNGCNGCGSIKATEEEEPALSR